MWLRLCIATGDLEQLSLLQFLSRTPGKKINQQIVVFSENLRFQSHRFDFYRDMLDLSFYATRREVVPNDA